MLAPKISSSLLLAIVYVFSLGPVAHADARPVATLSVEHQTSYQAQRLFAGRVLGSKRANIAFEFSGRVQSIAVEDGDYVEQGQELARLDIRALEIQRSELEAARKEVKAKLIQVSRELNRFKKLVGEGYVSKDRMDDLMSSKIATQAQLNQVEEKLRGLRLNLQKSVLRAPFAGEVAGLSIEEGVIAQPGQPALQLVEVAQNEAVFGVPGAVGAQLAIGQPLKISGDFGRSPATLVSVSRNLDWRTQTRTVRVSLPTTTQVADGQTVYVLLPDTRPEPGFWLPKQALLEDVRGNWAVYQLVSDGPEGEYRVHKRSVRVLYQYQGQVFAQGELRDGDLLVGAGTHKLAPGERVRAARSAEFFASAGEIDHAQ